MKKIGETQSPTDTVSRVGKITWVRLGFGLMAEKA